MRPERAGARGPGRLPGGPPHLHPLRAAAKPAPRRRKERRIRPKPAAAAMSLFPSSFLFLFLSFFFIFSTPPASPSLPFEIRLKTLTWICAPHFGGQDRSSGRERSLGPGPGAPCALRGSPGRPPRRGRASSPLGCAPRGPRLCRHRGRPARAAQALVGAPGRLGPRPSQPLSQRLPGVAQRAVPHFCATRPSPRRPPPGFRAAGLRPPRAHSAAHGPRTRARRAAAPRAGARPPAATRRPAPR